MNSLRPKVLIVDEVPAIIRLLELELSIQGFVTAGCGIGEDTFRAIEEHNPNVILLELILPGANGLEMLREIKERYKTPVLVLTTLDSEADRAHAFDLGADDYVQKPFDPMELGIRVAQLINGPPLERRSIRAGDLFIDLTRQVARRGAAVLSLTTNEWAILLAMANRPDHKLVGADLGGMLGGDPSGMQPRMLTAMLHRMRQTLEEDPENPRVIVGDIEDGIRLGAPVTLAE
jgi:two-component system response regulator MtrA